MIKIIKISAEEDLPIGFYDVYEYNYDIRSVHSIIDSVKKDGDEAVRFYTNKFDNTLLDDFIISRDEIISSYANVDNSIIKSLETAAKNIELFSKKQLELIKGFEVEIAPGIRLGQRSCPIEKVGCYVPGGNYPLPSSALMSVIPARVSGVEEIIVTSPNINDVVIVAADLAGATQILKIGGAQAIAAMAYGTQTIDKVDKIVGPGNAFVTEAKKRVYGDVGIDFVAGPSEVMIIADDNANPAFVSADMLAQAEHDEMARADLICFSQSFANKVLDNIKIQLKTLSTRDIAQKALKNGHIIIVSNMETAFNIANKRAPEHLEVFIGDLESAKQKLSNYGSLFLGEYSAEVFGDYCSGTNHILPTLRAARYTGGLSVNDFIKIMTYQNIDKKAIDNGLGKVASALAGVEGLQAHKLAADIRMENL